MKYLREVGSAVAAIGAIVILILALFLVGDVFRS